MEILRDLPTGVLVALSALLLLQFSLQIWGLIDLTRRPVVPGGRKWVWALIIVLGNLLGAVAYLALGRSAHVASTSGELPAPGREGEREQAIDRLYGDRDA